MGTKKLKWSTFALQKTYGFVVRNNVYRYTVAKPVRPGNRVGRDDRSSGILGICLVLVELPRTATLPARSITGRGT